MESGACFAYSRKCKSSQPVVCSSKFTTRTGSLDSHALSNHTFRREFVKGSSRDSLPWSTSIRTDSDTKPFEVEPMRKSVSGVAEAITGQVGHTEAGDPFGTIFVNDRDRPPIRVGVFEDLLYLLAEFVDRSGRFRLFVLSSESIRGEHSSK